RRACGAKRPRDDGTFGLRPDCRQSAFHPEGRTGYPSALPEGPPETGPPRPCPRLLAARRGDARAGLTKACRFGLDGSAADDASSKHVWQDDDEYIRP